MPRSPCLTPDYQDLRNELSRARHKISIMKKKIRHLEGMLETRDSDRTTLLSDGFDESVYFECIHNLSEKLAESKNTYVSLLKEYQEVCEKAEREESRADLLDDEVVELRSEVTTLRTAYYRVKRKSENRKTELKNLEKCLKKRKDELKTREMIELQNDMLREEIASVSSDREDLLYEIVELVEKLSQQTIKQEEEMDAYKMTTERLEKELTQARSKLYQTEDRNAFLETLVQRCQEREQELLDKLDETEAKLLEKEDHSTLLQGVIQRCAENEQELFDELDDVKSALLEKEEHVTFLTDLVQHCEEIEQELYDRQQDLEARVIEWVEECSRLQNLLLSESLDVSEPSPDSECVQEDIGSVTGTLNDDVPYSSEEKQIRCTTSEIVTPAPVATFLWWEGGMPSDNFDNAADSRSGSTRWQEDKNFRQQQEPKSRKRRRSLSASCRNRSKRRPDASYSITTRPGIRRFFYYRRSWYRDKKNLEAQISILVDIDKAFTNLCVTTKRLCEAFRPRVDEVVKWVVRSPFLRDYDPATKCDLFQQVLCIRITSGGCVEDVVAMWCEGHGNAEPSWNNLLLALEESGCSCLHQTARCLRANLADCILKMRLELYYGLSGKVNCFGCGQEIPFFPEEIAHGVEESIAHVLSPVGQLQDPEGSEDT